MSWYESIKNLNLNETTKNWFGKSKNWVEEGVRAKGISDEHKDLLIKGIQALLLVRAARGHKGRFVFILSYAASEDFCEMTKNKLDEIKNWVEQEIRTKGISVENLDLDLLVKASGALLLATTIGYFGGLGNACGFLLKYAASDDYCCEMAKKGFHKSNSFIEMAKNRFKKSKSWTEEKIREKGISDEHRDLVVKAGGATLAATATMRYYYGGARGFLFRNGDGSVVDGQKSYESTRSTGRVHSKSCL